MSKNRVRVRVVVWFSALALLPAFLDVGCGGKAFTSTPLAEGGSAAGFGAFAGRAAGNAGDAADAGDANGGSAGALDIGGTGPGGMSAGGTVSAAGGSPAGGTAGISGSAGSPLNVGGMGGSGAMLDTVCPTEPPGSEACLEGLSCSYGDDLRGQCRSRYDCVAARWSATLVKCETLISCSDVKEGFPKQGDACDNVGDDCTLDNGPYGKVYCRCDVCTGAACTKNWECAGPPSGCPLVLPNEGQPCDSSGPSCLYGSCSMANALKVDCTKKTWRWSAVACPVPG